MRICHVTTFWPNRFGHTHYTDALIKGIQKKEVHQHVLAAEDPAHEIEEDGIRVKSCFKRSEDYVAGITETVRGFSPDVALIQYTPDVFGSDGRLIRLVKSLEDIDVRTIVNAHSVYPGAKWDRFDRELARVVSQIQVHSSRMKRDLLARGVRDDKVTVIPHGSLIRPPIDRNEARRLLGIPISARVLLFFGFIWLGKGLDFLLSAFADAAKEVPGAYLYLGGYVRHKYIYSLIYMHYLSARMRLLAIRDKTGMWGDYVPDDMVLPIFSASDCVGMPYKQDYSSVSGVVHQAAGMDCPMICSRISKFDEVGEGIDEDLLVPFGDRKAWARTIARLLSDEAWAEEIRGKVRAFAQKTSWENVGRQHLALYRSILAGTRNG